MSDENEDQTLVDVEALADLESENARLKMQLINADRTILKAKDTLIWAFQYFHYKAEMNAAQHMNGNVMTSPLGSNIQSVIHGIEAYHDSYGKS